jgi:hypothetical protein
VLDTFGSEGSCVGSSMQIRAHGELGATWRPHTGTARKAMRVVNDRGAILIRKSAEFADGTLEAITALPNWLYNTEPADVLLAMA